MATAKTFPLTSKDLGAAEACIVPSFYVEGGALCIVLWTHQPEKGPIEPLAKLSVNVEESQTLPDGCFYCKDWSENDLIVRDAAASGWFAPRLDLEPVVCGFELAWVWELREERGEGFDYDQLLED